jgi:hypothetical protein
MNRMAAGLLAAAALVAAAWPQSAAAALPEPARPAWVDRFPHDPDRYIGIGRIDKRRHPGDFRELAMASALAQISREISVEITAASTATRTENAGGAEETYAGRVAATTRNALTGYALEAVYETGGEFWACYALDKETWERAQAEKARVLTASLDRGLAEVEAEFEARRIQAAGARLEGLRKEYAMALAADPILRDRSRLAADRLSAQSAKLTSALRATRLIVSSGPWIFSPPASSPAAPAAETPGTPGTSGSEARAVLRDPDAGRAWLGPLTLRISEWPAGVAADRPECRIETDAAGRLDLAIPFQACGLASGTWRVAWTGPGPERREFHAETAAEWRPADVALAIAQERVAHGADREVRTALSEPGAALPEIRAALEGWPSRRYRIAAGNASLPILEVRIREVTLDTLEGMHFASIRASLIFPGRPGAVEARGKAGHADRGRALRRAAADFAREAAQAADQSAFGPETSSPGGNSARQGP